MPFIKGQSGNPGGRPKKDNSLTGLLKKELGKKDRKESIGKQRLVKKLIELAEGGDVIALKYIFDRVDGKPVETVRADLQANMIIDNAAAVAAKLEESLLNADG